MSTMLLSTRVIYYSGRYVGIVLQGDGAGEQSFYYASSATSPHTSSSSSPPSCPLIALINILSLRGVINIMPHIVYPMSSFSSSAQHMNQFLPAAAAIGADASPQQVVVTGGGGGGKITHATLFHLLADVIITRARQRESMARIHRAAVTVGPSLLIAAAPLQQKTAGSSSRGGSRNKRSSASSVSTPVSSSNMPSTPTAAAPHRNAIAVGARDTRENSHSRIKVQQEQEQAQTPLYSHAFSTAENAESTASVSGVDISLAAQKEEIESEKGKEHLRPRHERTATKAPDGELEGEGIDVFVETKGETEGRGGAEREEEREEREDEERQSTYIMINNNNNNNYSAPQSSIHARRPAHETGTNDSNNSFILRADSTLMLSPSEYQTDGAETTTYTPTMREGTLDHDDIIYNGLTLSQLAARGSNMKNRSVGVGVGGGQDEKVGENVSREGRTLSSLPSWNSRDGVGALASTHDAFSMTKVNGATATFTEGEGRATLPSVDNSSNSSTRSSDKNNNNNNATLGGSSEEISDRSSLDDQASNTIPHPYSASTTATAGELFTTSTTHHQQADPALLSFFAAASHPPANASLAGPNDMGTNNNSNTNNSAVKPKRTWDHCRTLSSLKDEDMDMEMAVEETCGGEDEERLTRDQNDEVSTADILRRQCEQPGGGGDDGDTQTNLPATARLNCRWEQFNEFARAMDKQKQRLSQQQSSEEKETRTEGGGGEETILSSNDTLRLVRRSDSALSCSGCENHSSSKSSQSNSSFTNKHINVAPPVRIHANDEGLTLTNDDNYTGNYSAGSTTPSHHAATVSGIGGEVNSNNNTHHPLQCQTNGGRTSAASSSAISRATSVTSSNRNDGFDRNRQNTTDNLHEGDGDHDGGEVIESKAPSSSSFPLSSSKPKDKVVLPPPPLSRDDIHNHDSSSTNTNNRNSASSRRSARRSSAVSNSSTASAASAIAAGGRNALPPSFSSDSSPMSETAAVPTTEALLDGIPMLLQPTNALAETPTGVNGQQERTQIIVGEAPVADGRTDGNQKVHSSSSSSLSLPPLPLNMRLLSPENCCCCYEAQTSGSPCQGERERMKARGEQESGRGGTSAKAKPSILDFAEACGVRVLHGWVIDTQDVGLVRELTNAFAARASGQKGGNNNLTRGHPSSSSSYAAFSPAVPTYFDLLDLLIDEMVNDLGADEFNRLITQHHKEDWDNCEHGNNNMQPVTTKAKTNHNGDDEHAVEGRNKETGRCGASNANYQKANDEIEMGEISGTDLDGEGEEDGPLLSHSLSKEGTISPQRPQQLLADNSSNKNRGGGGSVGRFEEMNADRTHNMHTQCPNASTQETEANQAKENTIAHRPPPPPLRPLDPPQTRRFLDEYLRKASLTFLSSQRERRGVVDNDERNSPPGFSSSKLPFFHNFLLTTISRQVTTAGLFALNDTIDDRELVIFFRKNEFTVLTKRNDRLLELVVDEAVSNALIGGGLHSPDKNRNICWQTITSADDVEEGRVEYLCIDSEPTIEQQSLVRRTQGGNGISNSPYASLNSRTVRGTPQVHQQVQNPPLLSVHQPPARSSAILRGLALVTSLGKESEPSANSSMQYPRQGVGESSFHNNIPTSHNSRLMQQQGQGQQQLSASASSMVATPNRSPTNFSRNSSSSYSHQGGGWAVGQQLAGTTTRSGSGNSNVSTHSATVLDQSPPMSGNSSSGRSNAATNNNNNVRGTPDTSSDAEIAYHLQMEEEREYLLFRQLQAGVPFSTHSRQQLEQHGQGQLRQQQPREAVGVPTSAVNQNNMSARHQEGSESAPAPLASRVSGVFATLFGWEETKRPHGTASSFSATNVKGSQNGNPKPPNNNTNMMARNTSSTSLSSSSGFSSSSAFSAHPPSSSSFSSSSASFSNASGPAPSTLPRAGGPSQGGPHSASRADGGGGGTFTRSTTSAASAGFRGISSSDGSRHRVAGVGAAAAVEGSLLLHVPPTVTINPYFGGDTEPAAASNAPSYTSSSLSRSLDRDGPGAAWAQQRGGGGSELRRGVPSSAMSSRATPVDEGASDGCSIM